MRHLPTPGLCDAVVRLDGLPGSGPLLHQAVAEAMRSGYVACDGDHLAFGSMDPVDLERGVAVLRAHNLRQGPDFALWREGRLSDEAARAWAPCPERLR